MNNPFDYTPDPLCDEAFRELTAGIERLRKSGRAEDLAFCNALDEGVMLGVLIAEDRTGARHSLYAFSGQVGEGGFHHPGFVGPVFDYLRPDGYFKTREREISLQNRRISEYESEVAAAAKREFEETKRRLDRIVADFREKCRQSKSERDARRRSGMLTETENRTMVTQSQFEKAELHRLKKRAAAELAPYSSRLTAATEALNNMKRRRREDSEKLQRWLFDNFQLLNAEGRTGSLSDIFAGTPTGIPPSGAGECCAPKLLQEAYIRGWKPLTIAEYWYGKEKEGSLRRHGEHYPACRGRCLPVLTWMLQGLEINPPLDADSDCCRRHAEPEIIFENEWFCVVNKPAGMLSVPGKGAAVSVQQWLTEKFGTEREVRMAHRLDRDTSGLIVATFGNDAYKEMQSLFATRKVAKTYIADLEGDYLRNCRPDQGIISLPLSADLLDRPRQRVDHLSGKEARTEYRFTGVSAGRSRVEFHPLTGRTHQLRVHAASAEGLGMPIAGDPLYGKNAGRDEDRLHLHAHIIEFTFPRDGHSYRFEAPLPF